MAKLARCPAGHVYDREAHAACPECARTGVPAQEAPSESLSGADTKTASFRSWLIGGGAGLLVLLVAGYSLFGSSSEQASDKPEQAAFVEPDAPEFQSCAKASPARVESCGKLIDSGKYGGRALGALYRYRGFVRSQAAPPDRDGAIADFTKAAELEQDRFAALALRGRVYLDLGKIDLALKDVDAALAIKPEWGLYNDRGLAHLRTKQYDLAIADFDQANKLEPKSYLPHWNRGLAWRDKGDSNRAAQDFKVALSLNPDAATKGRIERALAALSTTTSGPLPSASTSAADTAKPDAPKPDAPKPEPEAAKSEYEICTRQQGDSAIAACDAVIASGTLEDKALANAYIFRGALHHKKKNFDAGIADFSEALKRDGDNAIAYADRGESYRKKGDLDQAVADLDAAIKLYPKFADAYYFRGLAYADKGDYDKAIPEYSATIALKADHIRAYAGRGDAYRRKGDREHASADYRKALSMGADGELKKRIEAALYVMAPSEPAVPAVTNVGKDSAPTALQPSAASESAPTTISTSVAEQMSDADFKACQGSGIDKLESCNRALASGRFSNPVLSMLHNNKGSALYGQGHRTPAAAEFDKAIELASDNPAAYANRARYRNDIGDADGAIADATKSIELDAKHVSPFAARGTAYARKQDYPHAIADATKAVELEPDNYFLYLMRGLYYRRSRQFELAIADLHKALTLNPSDQDKKNINKLLSGIQSELTSPAGGDAKR